MWEFLHDVQVSLKSLDLGGEVFSQILDRFILREEVKCLVDVSAKDVNTPKFINQKVSQSVMLLKGPWLVIGMTCRVSATFTMFSTLIRVNLFRTADNQG